MKFSSDALKAFTFTAGPAREAHDSRLRILSKDDNSMFIPQRLESVKYEGKNLQAYPFTGTDAPPAERVYALTCNRRAAENAFLGPQQTIAFYASRADLDSQASVAMSQWTCRLTSNWSNPAHLTVLGYYSSAGARIADAIDPATGVLRPITDGPANTRRPADVRFAKVSLTVDYRDLHHADEPCNVRMNYYIPLPQGDVNFTNPAGVVETRHTCTINGDPFALATDDFRAQVIAACATNGPIDIKPPSIAGHDCIMDDTSIIQLLHKQILQVGAESIFISLREQMAPGYAATSHSTCEKITMSFTDDSGNTHSLTVQEYFHALLQGASPFLDNETYQYNLANHFVFHLEPSLRDKFVQRCDDHLRFADLSRDAQMRQLSKYLRIATECENDVKATKRLVNNTISNTHSFLGSLLSAFNIQLPEGTDFTNPSFLSAAEKTLQQYKGDPTKKRRIETMVKEIKCWGCGGGHWWRDRRTKEILCPNALKPGVAENAAKAHKKFLEEVKAKSGFVPAKKIKFEHLSAEQKEVGRQFFMEQANQLSSNNSTSGTSATSSITTPSAAGATNQARSYPTIYIVNHGCNKPVLPVAVDPQLPHITLTLGKIDQPMESCAQIRVLVDSGACMSSGYADFWLPILKAHPECIADMYTSDDGKFTPIILGGIVTGADGDMSNHTTELNLVVKLHLRYETTNHQPITHTIAIGSSVGGQHDYWQDIPQVYAMCL